jgi:hypothetical protein
MLEAWSLFLSGDLLIFKTTMQSITTHVRMNDERLIKSISGILQSIRLSLSCFYDSAETIITNLIHSPSVSPLSTPRSIHVPRSSIRLSNHYNYIPSLSRDMIGSYEFGKNIFLQVAEAFLISRKCPKELPLIDMTIICAKISIRAPCSYIGGVHLFFTALAALAVYDDTVPVRRGYANSVDSDTTSSDGDTTNAQNCIRSRLRSSSELESLLEAVETVVEALNLLSTRHTVLVYMSKAVTAHYLRLRGRITEALDSAIDSFHISHPADSAPLGVGYLKMEIALCKQASHDSSWDVKQTKKNLESIISTALEAIIILEPYGADIEINILQCCISNSEDHLNDLNDIELE